MSANEKLQRLAQLRAIVTAPPTPEQREKRRAERRAYLMQRFNLMWLK